MTAHRRWWRPRSLRQQLAVWVSLIVCVATIGVGAVAVLSMRDYVTSLGDAEVANSLATFEYSYGKGQDAAANPQPIPAAPTNLIDFPGQGPGTVIAVLHDGQLTEAAVFTEGEPVPAPPDVVRALQAVSWENGNPQTVDLGSLGSHRLLSGGTDDERLVSAVSLIDANQALARKTITIALLVLLALVGTAVGAVIMVRYALAPLRRVASTAGRVATLPLDAAHHRITARVGDADIDPDNEVGVVGNTLNRLLDNVDSALTELAESDLRMRQFLTDASHELRTPLASILGYAELTRQDSAALPLMTEYALARIEAESRRMTALVGDLLLLSRLDEGGALDIEDIDLGELVTDAVNDAAVAAPDHHFATDLPDDAIWVRGDRARLQQLITNLLSNASVHTAPGVTVTTGLTPHRDVVELTVTDDGGGIPADVMPNLFGRFVRADKSRSRELGCTGLGLAIAVSIVKAHDGAISADSVPGKTVFTVRLPAARTELAQVRQDLSEVAPAE